MREVEIYSNMVDKKSPSDYFILALKEVECQCIDNKEFNWFSCSPQKFSGCFNHTNESLKLRKKSRTAWMPANNFALILWGVLR